MSIYIIYRPIKMKSPFSLQSFAMDTCITFKVDDVPLSYLLPLTVPVSTPVIRTVGKVIVKQPFQILCESTLGTLPITYTLLKSQSQLFQTNTIGPLRTALFNITSISQKDEIHSFKCRAETGAENSELSQALTSAVIGEISSR